MTSIMDMPKMKGLLGSITIFLEKWRVSGLSTTGLNIRRIK